MRPAKVRSKMKWDTIENYRKEHRLSQTKMARILNITRCSYGNEIIRHVYAPMDVYKRFQSYLALPKPEEQKDYLLIAWDGENGVILDDPVYKKQCASCNSLILTTNPSKKYCEACKKK